MERFIITGNRNEVAPIFRALGQQPPAKSGQYELALDKEQRDKVLLKLKLDGIFGNVRRQLENERKTDRIFTTGKYTHRGSCSFSGY